MRCEWKLDTTFLRRTETQPGVSFRAYLSWPERRVVSVEAPRGSPVGTTVSTKGVVGLTDAPPVFAVFGGSRAEAPQGEGTIGNVRDEARP